MYMYAVYSSTLKIKWIYNYILHYSFLCDITSVKHLLYMYAVYSSTLKIKWIYNYILHYSFLCDITSVKHH